MADFLRQWYDHNDTRWNDLYQHVLVQHLNLPLIPGDWICFGMSQDSIVYVLGVSSTIHDTSQQIELLIAAGQWSNPGWWRAS